MLATVLVLSLIVVAFWRSLLRFVIAALVVFLVIGGIQAVQTIGALVTITPGQSTNCPADQNQHPGC